MALSVFEICAGVGGQAEGLEEAGFELAAAVEIDHDACATLRENRPHWQVIEADLREIDGEPYRGVDLLAGGVPCPPFSIAGKQLGIRDERNLFPDAVRLVRGLQPAAVMLENVPGFAMAKFRAYRGWLIEELSRLGYYTEWRLLNACSFGIAQLRPRFVLVGIRERYASSFEWPKPNGGLRTVGECIGDLMASRGWEGSETWRRRASGIAPTIVGGSKKHGGPDLGPTRAKQQWRKLAVDGHGIANEPPDRTFPREGNPRLTVRMVARLQGISDEWTIKGAKTSAYRQVGNAFPPPVARAVGESIVAALVGRKYSVRRSMEASLFTRERGAVKYSTFPNASTKNCQGRKGRRT